MKKLLYISSNNVNVFNGNSNAEFQRLTYLSKYFEIHYLSLSSTKLDVDNFLLSKNLDNVIVLSSFKFSVIRFLFTLNYYLNRVLCTNLGFFKSYRFFKVGLGKNFLSRYNCIFSFYIMPSIFLVLDRLPSHVKLFIDTNDIMVNRYAHTLNRSWYTIDLIDELKFNKVNIYFLCISDNDYDYYSGRYSRVLKLYFSPPPQQISTSPDRIVCGYIASKSKLNIEEFDYCFENNLFDIFENNSWHLLFFGGIGKYASSINAFKNFSNSAFLDSGSLIDFYNNVTLLFVPCAPSTGIKTKILEALFYGKIVITTQYGYDSSMEVFGDNIMVLDYPILIEDLDRLIKNFSFEVTCEIELGRQKYLELVENQFGVIKDLVT